MLKHKSGKYNFLIVDDNKDYSKLLEKQLKNLYRNISTTLVSSGEEALEKLATYTKYDKILLDVGLPGMSGIELFENIKDQGIPITIISGRTHVSSDVPEMISKYSLSYASKTLKYTELGKILNKDDEKLEHRLKIDIYKNGKDCHTKNIEKYIDQMTIDEMRGMLGRRFIGKTGRRCFKAEPISPNAACGSAYGSIKEAAQCIKDEMDVTLLLKDPGVLSLSELRRNPTIRGIFCQDLNREDHVVIDLINAGYPIVKGDFKIHVKKNKTIFEVGNAMIKAGSGISWDGNTGDVYPKYVETKASVAERGHANEKLTKSDQILYDKFVQTERACKVKLTQKKMEVMINADESETIRKARKLYGIEGIGLVRSENILKNSNLQDLYGNIILSLLSKNEESANEYLKQFRQSQYEGFRAILEEQGDRWTQIRLLDVVLGELFDIEKAYTLGGKLNGTIKKESLLEFINMLLHSSEGRGVQLIKEKQGLFKPIYERQLDALCEASYELKNENLKVIIPYITDATDVGLVQEMADKISKKYSKDKLFDLGATLETPKGLGNGAEIMERYNIRYFSLGTNDLLTLWNAGQRNIYRVEDGKSIIDPTLKEFIVTNIRNMNDIATTLRIKDELVWGMPGEMNETKLESLKEVLRYLNYISAGSVDQIPILEKLVASMTFANN